MGKATEDTIRTVDESVNFAADVVQEVVDDAVETGRASVEHLQRITEGMLKTSGEFVEDTVEAVQDTSSSEGDGRSLRTLSN